MERENTPLHQLFRQLIADEKLDPALAKKLLEEILSIIAGWKDLDDSE